MRTWSSNSLRSIPAKRSAKAFMSGARIAVRTTRTPDDLNTSANRAELRVVVANDNQWHPVHGGVPGLLPAPLVGRRIRHRGMENRSATQVQEEEYEHLAEPHVERLHEVTRPRHVVSQERRPALPVASGSIVAQVPLNRSLADVDSQLEQLTTDALGSPAWVAPRHFADERDPLRRWSTGSPRATPPERAESCAMPAENGSGLDEQGCFTPSWRNSRGENNREALPGRPADAAGDLPLRGDELLPKKRILRNQFNATANEIRSQPGNEPKKIDHVSSLTPSTCGWNL